jgi:hypothetical protein
VEHIRKFRSFILFVVILIIFLEGARARGITTISRDGGGKREGVTGMKSGEPDGEGVVG